MADPAAAKNEVLDEIMNRGKLGDKKFHSETSLQKYGDDEPADVEPTDPEVQNDSIGNSHTLEVPERRRTMSQPGPGSGNRLTATAARAARKRPPRYVNYAADLERSDSNSEKQSSRVVGPFRGDESGSATPVTPGDNPFSYNSMNGNYKNGDAKSLNSYRLYMTPNEMRGSAPPRPRSVLDAQSIRSVETHAPPPTSPEENKKQTKKYLTLIVSCIYAILLVTLGLIIHVGDSFVDAPMSVIYSLILCSIGLLYLLYLMVDIAHYKRIAVKNYKIKSLHDEKLRQYFMNQEESFGQMTPGDRTPEIRPNMPAPVLIPIKHEYCFSQGRHSGSFYLKLGAAGFALGHLVHSVLLLAVQIGLLTDENIDNDKCVSIPQVVLDVMVPIYCFLQLFFVFKYSNVIILKVPGLAYLAFMHLIGTSLCFWISAIVREVLLGLRLYANTLYGGNNSVTTTTVADSEVFENVFRESFIQSRFFDVSDLHVPECIGSQAINSIFENFSPYLYPFSVEFNILIVAVYYIVWSNVGNCHSDSVPESSSSSEDQYLMCRMPTANEDNDFTSNIVIYADCHASNRGLFLGLVVMVIIIGLLIIGFVFSSVGDDFMEIGHVMNEVTELCLHAVLLFSAVFAFNQMRHLDINEHPISLLDDVLLFICLPAFFIETALSLYATISLVNIVRSINFCLMVLQVVIQVPLIMDGLRRCSNTKKLRRKKPGREILMFLLITNVAMWIFYTFRYKSPDSLDDRYTFYGKVTWTILGHISLPLIMFFRFHSSVCFADIWNSAYQPGSEH